MILTLNRYMSLITYFGKFENRLIRILELDQWLCKIKIEIFCFIQELQSIRKQPQ